MIKADKEKEVVVLKGYPCDMIDEIANVCYVLFKDAAKHNKKTYLNVTDRLLAAIAAASDKVDKEFDLEIDWHKHLEETNKKLDEIEKELKKGLKALVKEFFDEEKEDD